MKRMHVNVQVREIGPSVSFYSELFGAAPTVLKHDYAKWMLEDPRVNFSIASTGGQEGLRHLGIQAEDTAELAVVRERATRAGGTLKHEGETLCCYARSDKTWVTDAQGVVWEVFYTHEAVDAASASPAASRRREAGAVREAECCEPGCCEAGRTGADAGAGRGEGRR